MSVPVGGEDGTVAENKVRCPAELQRACDRAEAGDVILVMGGLYDTPSVLRGRQGGPVGRSSYAPPTQAGYAAGRCPILIGVVLCPRPMRRANRMSPISRFC